MPGGVVIHASHIGIRDTRYEAAGQRGVVPHAQNMHQTLVKRTKKMSNNVTTWRLAIPGGVVYGACFGGRFGPSGGRILPSCARGSGNTHNQNSNDSTTLRLAVLGGVVYGVCFARLSDPSGRNCPA